ncbi:PadR family transcriptional regulator [Hazenella coriacea]|uniref:PadR family transcriptional regulator n=1 Tax=Hazenella coriacea TaxID=1179467 RepID=A0A4R3L2G3_9BACL|nr:PadR family transcriptional regulator [Hazenella coriacea]TCS92380.1 PadR family transcriptional regulator [Hazenella coriacea]
MSVKHAILGLLYQQPRYGYELKLEFERMLYQFHPLNQGQIYSTLERLVRDSLVELLGQDQQGRKQYIITELGKSELHDWLLTPVPRSVLDNFLFKLICAREIHFSNIQDMIAQYRSSLIQNILHFRTLQNGLHTKKEKNIQLIIEAALLHLEADIEWLNLLEEELKDS